MDKNDPKVISCPYKYCKNSQESKMNKNDPKVISCPYKYLKTKEDEKVITLKSTKKGWCRL